MKIKSLRNVLMAATGISLASMIGAGAWALLGGSGDVPVVDIRGGSQQSPTAMVTAAPKEMKNFDNLLNLALQGPRDERSAQIVAPTVVPQATVGFGILLVGTVIEPSKTLALFRDGRGAFDLKGVGQPLELTPAGAQVASIEPDSVTLRYEGRDVRLPLAAGTTPIRSSAIDMSPMQPAEMDSEVPTEPEPEPIGMMTPMSPADAAPAGEDDIFAPLPAHLNPYAQPANLAPMEPGT